MCGLAGYHSIDQGCEPAVLRAMGAAIRHRGPDDDGLWHEGPIGFAHRRLAVVELGPAGHQPMASGCGRWVIAYNGEIYNHLEIRERLSGIAWRGHSDTETLIEAIAAWGIERALRACVGMFAFALWDRHSGELTLARDRLGEKPLYYGWVGRDLLFGSELGALRAHPRFDARIDAAAARELLRYGHIVAPRSIHPGIRALLPGHWLTIAPGRQDRSDEALRAHCYWSAADAAENGRRNPLSDDFDGIVDALEAQLGQTLEGQRIADVPLGVFLSGGIDSTLITLLLAKRTATPVQTFTIGFDEAGFDESVHARAVATHLGCAHHEIRLRAADALALVPTLANHFDEPFSDSAALPMLLMSRAARQSLTVALGGDGGDECFGGYPSHQRALGLARRLGRAPRPVRRAMAGAIDALSPGWTDRMLGPLTRESASPPSRRLRTLGAIVGFETAFDIYRRLDQHDPAAALMLRDSGEASASDPYEIALGAHRAGLSARSAMALADQIHTLPNRLLVKVDRAAMAASLETRSPLLDHRLVELAWRIPPALHDDARGTKRVLRAILARHLPASLYERPKAGFAVPIAQWLRGPLRDWAETMLAESTLARHGLLDPVPVRSLWAEHLAGRDQSVRLWDLLALSSWCEASGASA